jgi:phosphotransferase system enzyme I (PtsP)
MFHAKSAQDGVAEGWVYLHEPRVVVTNPIADDPEVETQRLEEALDRLRISVDQMLTNARSGDAEQLEVLEAYRLFANSKGWRRRMEEDIQRGLSAEAAVEKEQSAARSRMGQSKDSYLRERPA